ncbi:hypothetical protein VTN49DRAFT_7522 [Thermomyces lanuginosus]|uniref:uncharacterized protein n=1 Tax=Thermomyces lanuginosus TaxID=5541 RepID=UPI003742752B
MKTSLRLTSRVRLSLALFSRISKAIKARCSIENNPTQSICMRGECDNAGTSSVLSRISQIIPSSLRIISSSFVESLSCASPIGQYRLVKCKLHNHLC